jgi:hypothetical protein
MYLKMRGQPLTPGALFERARDAVEQNQFYAAILLAAVAFERAARDAAIRLDIDTSRMTVGKIVRAVGSRLPAKEMETLLTLLRLRNGLVHAESGAIENAQQAVDLIQAFQTGAGYLEMAASGDI